MTLGATTGLTFTPATNGTASMTFTGSPTNVNTALNGLSYLPDTNFVGTATLTDRHQRPGQHRRRRRCCDTDTVSITVTGVNDAPVNNVPAGLQTTTLNNPKVFNTAGGNLISITDVDAGAGIIQVSLSVTNGALTLTPTAGLTFSTGDGTADPTIVFTSTLANINTALNGLSYLPNLNFIGPRLADDRSPTTRATRAPAWPCSTPTPWRSWSLR